MKQLWWFALATSFIFCLLMGWQANAGSVQGLIKNTETVTVHGRDGTSGSLSFIEKSIGQAAVNTGSSTNVTSATLSDGDAPYLKIGGWCFVEVKIVSPLTLTAFADTPTRIRYDLSNIPVPTEKFAGSAQVEDNSGRKPGGILPIDSDSFEVVFFADGASGGANVNNLTLHYRCE